MTGVAFRFRKVWATVWAVHHVFLDSNECPLHIVSYIIYYTIYFRSRSVSYNCSIIHLGPIYYLPTCTLLVRAICLFLCCQCHRCHLPIYWPIYSKRYAHSAGPFSADKHIHIGCNIMMFADLRNCFSHYRCCLLGLGCHFGDLWLTFFYLSWASVAK